MAGKPIEIQKILSQDQLAKELYGLYNKWYMQRTQAEEEWREIRDYLFATDTTTTSNSVLPWKNKTTIPKLTQIRDNLHANYLDALFPNDNWLRWEGATNDDVTKQKRTAIEQYMKNKCREGGFQEEISRCLLDYIDYGNAFADVIWVNETHKDPLSGEDIVTYIGPKVVRISPHDIVFNPVVNSFKKSPKFTRTLKPIGELKQEAKNRLDLEYNQSVIEKIDNIRTTLSSFKMEDINKSDAFQVDGFGSLYEYLYSGYVEILEFEGDIYDPETKEYKQNRLITIVDRSHILRDIENKSWFGTDYKEHVSWRERPDNLYGMGPLANLVGMQYRLDHLENLKADAMDLAVQPPLKIVGDVEPFDWEPFSQVHVPEDGDVVPLFSNSNVMAVNNEIAYLLQLMEEMAGAPKEAMGIRSPGEKTAFEVQQLQNAAGRIFQHKVMRFEREFVQRLLNSMLELARRNMDTEDLVRILDDDLGVVDFMKVSKEDITAKGKLRPVGASHYAVRAQLIQNLNGIFNSQIGATIAPHISSKKLARLVEDVLGFEQYDFIQDNVAIFESSETQQLAQEAQNQGMVNQMTPVEQGIQGIPV